MATRYVWDKCKISYSESKKEIDTGTSGFDGGSKLYGSNAPPLGTLVGYASTGYTRNSDGTYDLSGTSTSLSVGDRITNQAFKYMAFSSINNDWVVHIKYWRSSTMYIAGGYHIQNAKYWLSLYWEDPSSLSTVIYEDLYRRTAGPGSVIERLSGASSSVYPTGENGGYWYIYKGSDNIDPTAISYSTTEPKGGETITATVTPGRNTYGGTIYYQYQYSTNGGSSWTNQGGKTTSTTQAFTIPKGAAQFRVRVVASDNYGFTSTTYVTGANLAVTNMRVYIGVGGKARKVGNLYIGVNGKARKVVKGYIGDASGKARAWF